MSSGTREVVLVGGPRDGDVVEASDPGLVEIEVGGMIHRDSETPQGAPVTPAPRAAVVVRRRLARARTG